jgi:hypothetical protein
MPSTSRERIASWGSATAVGRTRRRNAQHLSSGRPELETVALRDFETRGRQSTRPGGRLFLFYDTPNADRGRDVATRVADALRANGFAEPEIVRAAATLIVTSSRPRVSTG